MASSWWVKQTESSDGHCLVSVVISPQWFKNTVRHAVCESMCMSYVWIRSCCLCQSADTLVKQFGLWSLTKHSGQITCVLITCVDQMRWLGFFLSGVLTVHTLIYWWRGFSRFSVLLEETWAVVALPSEPVLSSTGDSQGHGYSVFWGCLLVHSRRMSGILFQPCSNVNSDSRMNCLLSNVKGILFTTAWSLPSQTGSCVTSWANLVANRHLLLVELNTLYFLSWTNLDDLLFQWIPPQPTPGLSGFMVNW